MFETEEKERAVSIRLYNCIITVQPNGNCTVGGRTFTKEEMQRQADAPGYKSLAVQFWIDAQRNNLLGYNLIDAEQTARQLLPQFN